MKQTENLLIDKPQPHTLRVTLNRPHVGNALNTALIGELLDVWNSLTANPEDMRCVILTGSGDRIFCAGGDLKQRNDLTTAQWKVQHELAERSIIALLDCPIPVIAAINGHAYGGGLETALACDFIYAVNTARFALTEVSLGIMPGGCGTQTLPRAVGERRAKELILTAKPFSAQQALQWCVVNELFEAVDLMPASLETAARISANAPLSVRQAKKSIKVGMQLDLKSAYMFEIECYNHLPQTEDRREGIRAFNEKRKPVYQGR